MIVWSGEERATAGGGDAAREIGLGRAGRARRPVLVVDDDRSILETVSAILRAEGYDVVAASNGREALEQLERIEPSVVLLDMRMPVLDGWDFAKAIAASGRRLPVIVMTAAENARRWAEEIDATAYIAKPFEIETLLDVVDRHSRPLN